MNGDDTYTLPLPLLPEVTRDIVSNPIGVPIEHAVRMCSGFNAALDNAIAHADAEGVKITSIEIVALEDESGVCLMCRTIAKRP